MLRNINYRGRHARSSTLILCSCLFAAACGIPDLKPFGDATGEMATQLRLGFDKTQAVIGFAAQTADENSVLRKKSQELTEKWASTRRAISALVDYSDSLAAIAEAGKKGEQTVGRLADAVQGIATSVGLAPFSSTAVDIAKFVGGKIIEMKAEKDIHKAVLRAAEAVDAMAPLLRNNFTDLNNIHEAAANAWQSHAGAPHSVLMNYYESLGAEERRMQLLLTLIIEYQSAGDRFRMRAVEARAANKPELAARLESPAAIEAERADQLKRLVESDATFAALDLSSGVPAKVETRQRQLMDLINAHRKEMATLEPKYRQAVTELDHVRETRQLGARVLAKAPEAIDAWQKAHRSLQATAEGKQRRPVVADLISIVKEIAALAKRQETL